MAPILPGKNSLEFFNWIAASNDDAFQAYLTLSKSFSGSIHVGNASSLMDIDVEEHERLLREEIAVNCSNSEDSLKYLQDLKKELNLILNKSIMMVPYYDYLHQVLKSLILSVDKLLSTQSPTIEIKDTPESALSFEWLLSTSKLELFYRLLVAKPPLIECSFDDCKAAFNGTTITKGIKWLAPSRSGEINKRSLFYLIDQLQDMDCIKKVESSTLSERIKYLFRDKDGNILKNLRQSKSGLREFSTASSEAKRIDLIIDQITSDSAECSTFM